MLWLVWTAGIVGYFGMGGWSIYSYRAVSRNVNDLKAEVRHEMAEVRHEVAQVREDMASGQDLAEVRNELAEVRNELAEVKAEVRNELAEVRQDMANFRDEVTTNLTVIKDFLFDPIDSVRLASTCAVRVQVSPSKDDNDEACGTLVTIGSEKFVMTNAHVVKKKATQSGEVECRRRVTRVSRQGGVDVAVDENSTLIHGGDLDLALIRVVDTSEALRFCIISNRAVDPSARIFGYLPSKRVEQERHLSGEIRTMTKDGIVGTMPGTNGHSGLGYFYRGEVVVVHTGSGLYEGSVELDSPYRMEDEGDEYATTKRNKEELHRAIKNVAKAPNKKMIELLVNTTFRLWNYWARNPVAKGVHARAALAYEVDFVPFLLDQCSETKKI